MPPLLVLFAGLLALLPRNALAHDGRVGPETWQTAWSFDPLVVFTLGVLTWLYGRGVVRRRRRSGDGGLQNIAQAAAFFMSLLVIAAALLSPLDALSAELSSFHMVQHMLLIAVAAPLLVLGSPAAVIAAGLVEVRHGLPARMVSRLLQLGNAPLSWNGFFVWTLFSLALWIWHHPMAYEAALADPFVHDAQHLSFFIAAVLFWRKCIDPLARRRLSALVAVPYLLATSMHATLLGVFLALSPTVWYEAYATRTTAWGFSPLEDQQLAGLLMWMPACLVYPLAAALLFLRWLSRQGTATPKVRTSPCRNPALVKQ